VEKLAGALEKVLIAFRVAQFLQVVGVAEYLRQGGENAQVLFLGFVRYQQGKNDVHRRVVHRFEVHGFFQGDESANGGRAVFSPGMGDRNAVADARGAETLPRGELAEQVVRVQGRVVGGDELRRLFENALLAATVQA